MKKLFIITASLILTLCLMPTAVIAESSWSTNFRVNDNEGDSRLPGWNFDLNPDIASDKLGNTYAVWGNVPGVEGDSDIHFSYRASGANWGKNERVNTDSGAALRTFPVIAVDNAGNAYAMWGEYRYNPYSGTIKFAYRPKGGNWEPEIVVAENLDSQWSIGFPDIAVDENGNAFAVWSESRFGGGDVYFSYRPAGGIWGSKEMVSDPSQSYWYPHSSIGIDGAGNVYVLYSIFFSLRSAETGEWSSSTYFSDNPSWVVSDPDIAVDPSGNAHAVWQDGRSAEYDVYYSYRPAGGNWGINLKVNDFTDSMVDAAVSVDKSGNIQVVWTTYTKGIYSSYKPSGGNFESSFRVDDNSQQARQYFTGSPAVSGDGNGDFYALWTDLRRQYGDVYFAFNPSR